ncbi:hypothetical protein J5TS1_29710 [Bacillus licheniformis]|nr:hypothetical protein BLHB2_30460 [Bacillus licheniformis]GIN25199.1 hypothetical protein J31TS2_17790 [Bacillus licheniformis]GIN30062.1 hypothetical protein J2TS5_21010 [Bacillus licheniformis]GIN35468.1 hypothetical protein J5TS1_29710 [Bacillus licheniformis]
MQPAFCFSCFDKPKAGNGCGRCGMSVPREETFMSCVKRNVKKGKPFDKTGMNIHL